MLLWPFVSTGQQDQPGSPHSPESGIEPLLRDFGAKPILPPILPPPDFVPRFPIRPPGVNGFPEMVRAAGIIFSGTVTGIRHAALRPGQPIETVLITFHVENAIRGATAGESLTISQWIGLWSAGQRYRVGERVLLFLYPPSKLGLTSSIGGAMGRFPIDSQGHVWLTAYHLHAFRNDSVLGGKSRVGFGDFASAVRRAFEEE